MAQILVDEKKLKSLLKETLTEMIEQKKDFFHQMITETIEDIAMTNAIREGESTESISKNEVFNVLEGKT